MSTPKHLLLFLLLVPLALMTKAGTGKLEGVLHGYVTDAVTKKPLPGVIVSACIPGTNNLREVLTDADGYFRFAELPAVQITVEFNKKGYQPCKRPNVMIKEKAAGEQRVSVAADAGCQLANFPIAGYKERD
jgi:hypothetical protein